MDSPFRAPRECSLPSQCHPPSPTLRPQTASRRAQERAPAPPLHPASQLPRCRTPLPATQHSLATARLFLSSHFVRPNPPRVANSLAPSSVARGRPPCRIEKRAAGLRLPACLPPKPL